MSDLGALPRILKDPTRRRVLDLLAQKGALSYVEILNALEIEHTGKLNYHLKLLGDLLAKDEAGRYILTEKGRLGTQILSKFEPIRPRNDLTVMHLTGPGLGKLLFALVIPSFILSLIPLSDDYWEAGRLSLLLGIITAMLLIFGSTFIMQKKLSIDGGLSLFEAWKYGLVELGLFLTLLAFFIEYPILSTLSTVPAVLVYLVVLPGYVTWLLTSMRAETHRVDEMLKATIIATIILWTGGLLLATTKVLSLDTNEFAITIILAELSLFVGQLASEGAYRLVWWRRRM